MADSIGPNPYQGGIAGGGAPQVNRYNQQVDINGAPQPADARGQKVISGFGEAAPELARGLDTAGEVARQLWLEQQKSAAQLYGQQALAHAAATAQPGQRISQVVNKGVGQFTGSLISAANTPQMKAFLSSELGQVTGKIQAQGQALDQRQTWDDAMRYFDQTLANKEKIYGTLTYDQIDDHLSDDLGGINSRITRLPLPRETRVQMQQELLGRLTEAANAAKIRQDPDRYLAKDAVEAAPQPADAGRDNADIEEAGAPPPALSYVMGTADQRQRWREDALRTRDGRIADATQAAQQQAAMHEQAHRGAINALIDKYGAGQLTSNAVLDSGLPAGQQQQAIDMMSRDPASPGNPALHRQLVMQALNGGVTDKSDLLPDMARPDGINPAQAQNVAAAAQLANEPYVKRFLASAQDEIIGRQNGFIADPQGNQQFSSMLLDLAGQITDAQKKGLSARDILDPDSKYFVGDRLRSAYMRSPLERLTAGMDMQRQLQSSLGENDARAPEEMFLDYMKRQRQKP